MCMPSFRSLAVVERYSRNAVSEVEQETLQAATVAIIGCGGLGGRVAELLARLGVGTLLLTDPDVFSISNLNRQMFCTRETLGLEKVAVLARELPKINPEIIVRSHVENFNECSIEGADIVVDGLDSGNERRRLAKLCRTHSLSLVHGAVKQWYGQAGVDSESSPIIDLLYPIGKTTDPAPEVMPMAVALIAALQAAEVCKFIINKTSSLQNGWLQCDLLHSDYDYTKISG